jgi:ABC-2 type transport system permease protein
VPAERRVVAGLVARRIARGALLWGAVGAVIVASSVEGFVAAYPTLESRRQLARTLTLNKGVQVLIGTPHRIDTVAGWTAWRSLGILTFVGAIWGLLAATRLLRGEEDAGRWELLVAGPTTRRWATAAAVTGLGAGLAVLLAVTALGVLAAGRLPEARFPLGSALFLAVALVAPAAVFLAVGALTSQLASTRRQAATLAAGVFGVAFVLRMAADTASGLAWMRWLTPLGWISALRPMTGSHLLPLVPLAGSMVGLGLLSVHLAGRRDAGAGLIPASDQAEPRTALLGGPFGLAVRLGRPGILGWAAAVAGLSLLFALVARSLAGASSSFLDQAFARFGARQSGLDAYLGMFFMIIGAVIAFCAATQVTATREEEADGRLDALLVRPVSRTAWLAGRVAVAAGALVVLGLAAGVASWAGAASQHAAGAALPRLLVAGLNVVPPALLVLGVGTLAHGLAPRLAGPLVYAVVASSFVLNLLGTLGSTSRWLLDLSLFHHLALVPAADLRWEPSALMVGIGLAGVLAGAAALRRRDLAGA